MIESGVTFNQYLTDNQNIAAPRRKVLKMVSHERMGGSVPVWETASSPAQKTQEQLSLASVNPERAARDFDSILDDVLAIQDPVPQQIENAQSDQEFGFGDLVDMVNPLHHIPVAGGMYRDMTGDEIKPIARLVGAGLFGGPLAAGGAVVNMVVEHETGRSIADTAFAALTGEDGSETYNAFAAQDPESLLNDVVALLEQPEGQFYDLPGSALAYADLSAVKSAPREPITEVKFDKPLHTQTARYND